MLWRVPREWDGETVFIVAGGPSLRGFDFGVLRGRRVVAINSSYACVPDADYLVFTDYRWWVTHEQRVRSSFRGKVVTLTPVRRNYDDLLVLERQRSGGVSADPTRLAWFHTTLTTALNLVGLLGASRAGLLGADGCDATDGSSWHHEPHPEQWGRNPRRYRYHTEALDAIAEPMRAMGCEVYNLNVDSAYRSFKFATVREMLQ